MENLDLPFALRFKDIRVAQLPKSIHCRPRSIEGKLHGWFLYLLHSTWFVQNFKQNIVSQHIILLRILFQILHFLCIRVVWAGIDSVMNGSHIRCSIRHGVATNKRFCLLLCNDSLTMPEHYCCMNLFTEIESHQLNCLHMRKTTTSSLKPGW